MSGHSDSLQTGLRLYNEGKISEALTSSKTLSGQILPHITAKEYAGISAFRLKEYDRALSWFEQVETHKGPLFKSCLYL
ncbi:MAG: hypothetical protein WDM78_19820 [Puia sp.]